MATALIQIARREREYEGRTGPKAAFDFFQNLHVPTVADRQAQVRAAGNKKQQFEAFCAIYGAEFGDGRTNGTAVIHSERQRESLTEKLARLLSRDTEEVGVEVFEDEDTDVEPAAPAVDPLVSALAEKLGVNVETLAALVSDEPVETPAPAKAERTIPAAKRISFPMAMALKKIATAQGKTFEIVSKAGGEGTGEPANYGIKFAGRKLTPVKASEIIGASKA